MSRSNLPGGGSAVALFGRAPQVCAALKDECRGETLAVVVAASTVALRSLLDSRALRHTNVVGAVDRSAFAADDMAHVVAAHVGSSLDVVTFDSTRGALPELGRQKLEAALDPRRAPHFVVFAGERRGDGADDGDGEPANDEDAPGAVLETFRRRVEGLFGAASSCSGVVARRDGSPARVVHARRLNRPGRRRAGRLKVYDAGRGGALVGVAFLPRAAGARGAGAATADALATLAFGGSGAKRLWAASDGRTGPDDQRVLAAAYGFYDAFDRVDADALRASWHPTAETSVVHPGAALVRGFANVQRSWRDLLASTRAGGVESFGLVVADLALDAAENVAFATCAVTSPATFGRAHSIQATNIFLRDGERWKLAHHHASVSDGLDDFDDDDLADYVAESVDVAARPRTE